MPCLDVPSQVPHQHTSLFIGTITSCLPWFHSMSAHYFGAGFVNDAIVSVWAMWYSIQIRPKLFTFISPSFLSLYMYMAWLTCLLASCFTYSEAAVFLRTSVQTLVRS